MRQVIVILCILQETTTIVKYSEQCTQTSLSSQTEIVNDHDTEERFELYSLQEDRTGFESF